MNPLKEILEWASKSFDVDYLDDWKAGHQYGQTTVLDLLSEYQQEPSWVCLEGMTVGELQAFDCSEALTYSFIKDILDGKDKGEGVCQEPWQSLRKQILEIMKNGKQ